MQWTCTGTSFNCSMTEQNWAKSPPARALTGTGVHPPDGFHRYQRPPSGRHGRSSAFPLVVGAEFLELCPHRRQPALEDTDDLVANLGRRESGSVYKPTPTVDFVLSAADHLFGIAIHA